MADMVVDQNFCLGKIRDYIENPQSDPQLLEDQKKKALKALALLEARYGDTSFTLVGCKSESMWIESP